MGVLCQITILAVAIMAISAITVSFDPKNNQKYTLNKPLAVGDTIKAMGHFKGGPLGKAKFNVNILNAKGLHLLHVDFRPARNVIVLNSRNPGWQKEIRPPPFHTAKHFKKGKNFEVKIVVHAKVYQIFFNGKKLAKDFPHRIAFAQGTHIICHDGAAAMNWVSLSMPAFGKVLGKGYLATTKLAKGDVITASAKFAPKTRFTINLHTAKGIMLHLDFRGPSVVVMNSHVGRWAKEVRTPFPGGLKGGKIFKIEIVCGAKAFQAKVNGKNLPKSFPYRAGFSLAAITHASATNNGAFKWVTLVLPKK